jgi:hypothetical protein
MRLAAQSMSRQRGATSSPLRSPVIAAVSHAAWSSAWKIPPGGVLEHDSHLRERQETDLGRVGHGGPLLAR